MGQEDNLAWAAAQGMALAGAAVQVLEQGQLDMLDKTAFLMAGFLLEVVGTFHKMIVVLVEVAQSPLVVQGDSHQGLEDTCPVACCHHQMFLTCWKPAVVDRLHDISKYVSSKQYTAFITICTNFFLNGNGEDISELA